MDSELKQLREQNNYLRQLIAFQNINTDNIFQQFSENIDDVFWLRTDTEMIYINPAFEKVWGIQCAEIYQKPQLFTDSIHPDDRKKVTDLLSSDSFKKTAIFEYEYRIIRPDNEIRWLSAKSMPVINEKGEIFRRVGVARDITVQKQSQEATTLLAEMLDIAPNSITVHDQKGRILYANQKTFEIHGYSREEFMALSLFTLDVPESAKLVEERIKTIREKGQARFEVEHFKKDGTKFPLEVYVKQVDWKGTPAMLSIATDISDRKKAEKTLRKSEEKFRTFVENANDVIYQITPEGEFTYVSPNWTEIMGYQSEEVVGEKIEKFAHPDDLHLCIAFLNKVLSTGEKQSGVEYRVKHKNGTWRWHNSTGAPIKDENGRIVSYLGIGRDITERKLQEKAQLALHQRYQTILKNFPNGAVFLVDKHLKYIHVEGKALKEVGLEPEKMIGKSVRDLLPPDVAEIAYQNLQLILEGKSCYYELWYAGRMYANWGDPVFDKENNVEEGVIFSVDITEKTQTQQRLLMSETKYKAAFLTSPDAVNINKLNGEYVEINEGFTRASGYTEKDVIGKLSSEINIWAIPSDREKLMEGLQNNGIVENLESLFRTKNGTLVPALLSAKIMYLNNEPHILSVTRDITDRKKIELLLQEKNEKIAAQNDELFQTNKKLTEAKEKAEENEKRFRNTILFSPIPTAIANNNGELILLNNQFISTYGYTTKELPTIEKWFELAYPDAEYRNAVVHYWNAEVENSKKNNVPVNSEEFFVTCKNGEIKTVAISAYFEKDTTIGLFQDVTERKKSITALQQIEWMLTEKKIYHENPIPEYGDLSELNTNGTILSLVGKEQLLKITSEYFDLLETSSAIYETNGDYALGMFTSSWCQTMDAASRRLCNTGCNQEALNSGKWLCHESCWRDASLNAMNNRKPADVKCRGGINLYAVPIQANGKVIGAINFGYGNPPTDEDELQRLSSQFQVPIDVLRKKSREYQIRPQFIIDFAKRRIQHSAEFIGNLIERKQAEQLIHEKSEEIVIQNEELYKTNLKLTEAKEKAEESQKKYKAIADTSPLAIYISKGVKQIAEYINPTFHKLFGYSFSEVSEVSLWWPLAYPDEEYRKQVSEEWNKKVESAIQNKSDIEPMETIVTCKNGTKKNILWGFVSTGNENWAFGMDFTAYRSTEQDLLKAKDTAEANEQRFKSLIENAPDGVVIIDGEGKFIYTSPNASRLFGYIPDELLGQSGADFVHPEDLPFVMKTFESILGNPLLKPTVSYRFKRKTGDYRWIETRFKNLLSDKVINGIILNFTDITERRQILEDLVVAKEKAEESDRLKTAFIQNMSHEIRTPMNAIMGFSELLLNNLENKEKLQKFVSIINQRCSDLLVIIDDILDIAKIETGQLQLNEEKVNIGKLLQELEIIFNEQKLRLNRSHIGVVLKCPYQSPELYLFTDRSRLMQIFTNLIHNALKFTSNGKIEFGYTIHNGQIEFFVSDTGIGIPADKHEVIFERFIQLNPGTSRFSGGNGLGLSITKGLVKMLGGRIWLQSEIDKGTTFYFTIRTVIEKDINDSIDRRIDEISIGGFKEKTILIVEDDDYNKVLIKEILDNQGLNLIIAENGADSVQICLTTPVDLVLMDIGLPDFSGYKAIRQILLHKPDLKIIAQTAFASPIDKNKTKQAGCIDYISKPLKPDDLIRMIHRHL